MKVDGNSFHPITKTDRTEAYYKLTSVCRRAEDKLIFRGVECSHCGETHLAATRPEQTSVTEWCHACGVTCEHTLYSRMTDFQAWGAVILALSAVCTFILI